MNPQYSLANATQLHGKELSYNNIQDGNAAIEILKDFEGQFAAVGVKHMNPCGVGIGENIEAAWDKAYEADSISIFGGIVALMQKLKRDWQKNYLRFSWRLSLHQISLRKHWKS